MKSCSVTRSSESGVRTWSSRSDSPSVSAWTCGGNSNEPVLLDGSGGLRVQTAWWFMFATLVGISSAHGQESLQQVKALYASAAYEDALSMVGRLQATGRKPEFEQYRVYCLVALGRTAEAEKAIASVVVEHPSRSARRRGDLAAHPGNVSAHPERAGAGDRSAHVPGCARRVEPEGHVCSVHSVRVAGSIDRHAPSEPVPTPILRRITQSRCCRSSDCSRQASLTWVARCRLRPSAPSTQHRILRLRDPVASAPPQITSAVPVKQDLPVWVPTDQATLREFRGAIRVFITETGRCHGGGSLTGCPPRLRPPAASRRQDLDLPASHEEWRSDRL